MITTLAYHLPEPNVWLFRLSFWGIIGMLVLGGLGIYRASQNQFALHRDTKDVFLSMPVTLLNWVSLALLLWIGRQDSDLLRSLGPEAAQAATVWLGTFAIAIVQAKKCNPELSRSQTLMAAAGRLMLGTLAQIGAILIPLGCLFMFIGHMHTRRSWLSWFYGLEVRLLFLSLMVGAFQLVWTTIHETDREEVNEKRGWVYGVVNVVLFGLICWGGTLLCEQYEAATTDELLRVVEQKKPVAIRHIIAFNPELPRDEAILAATDIGSKKTLRALIRTDRDLATARDRANKNGHQQIVSFLK